MKDVPNTTCNNRMFISVQMRVINDAAYLWNKTQKTTY